MTKTTLHTAFALVPPGAPRRGAFGLLLMLAVVGWPQAAEAQLDPLLLLKRSLPSITTPQYRANVLVAVDVAPRMQYDADGNYYDPTEYARGNMWDTSLGVTAGNTTARYRRIYQGLQWSAVAPQKFNATKIAIVGDAASTPYTNFYQKTRLAVAKTALDQVIRENTTSARFGLLKMRQTNPRVVSPADGPVFVSDPGQLLPTDGVGLGLWKLYRGVVDGDNRSLATSTAPLVSPDGTNPNTTIQTILAQPFSSSTALMPAGNDSLGVDDAPLAHLLDDVRTEAARLLGLDTQCRNTVAVLITGGGEGTGGSVPSASSIASTFLTVTAGHRVPIYVIAIAPPATAVAELQAIATNSGGRYVEITKAQIDLAAANYVAVPEMVSAITAAVQHGFAQPADFNTSPTALLPYGPQSEFQVTSPIVGTVNLKNSVSITGTTLPNTDIINSTSGAEIPQRGNVMITAGFAMPGFDGRLRAFRMYKPVTDITKPSGYKFSQDGTALWLAKTPMADHCNDATASCRNIFTALPNGTTVAFNAANALTLTPYMNTWDVTGLINFVRRQPLGAIVSSTPAIMDPPSLDPPPDVDYPGFSDDNKERRTLIFVGANDGMIHAIDGRTGVEVWAFIPFNLLPKLRTLRDGQGLDAFDYFVDSSAKVADVKLGGVWKTLVVFGEGSGGTFYQAFDATLDGMGATVSPDSDNVPSLLSYFNSTSRIPFLWSFPRYSIFDVTLSQYGDVSASATDHEKSVGQTWSDPAVGQIKTNLSKYTVIAGSGFFPRSAETGAHRGGASAGRSLYLLNAEDGTVFDRKEATPSNDGLAETDDNCVAAAYGCTKMKNALQADPVATGPADSRFIGTTYIGDLDGNVWRFDIDLDGSNNPRFPSAPIKLATYWRRPADFRVDGHRVGRPQAVPVLRHRKRPAPDGRAEHHLQAGGRGRQRRQRHHHLPAHAGQGGWQRRRRGRQLVSGGGRRHRLLHDDDAQAAEPLCDARREPLRADVCRQRRLRQRRRRQQHGWRQRESPRVKTLAAAGRATAPFIVDQHLVFGAGNSIQVFGDANDYNNGVGHVGVRILSWRDLR